MAGMVIVISRALLCLTGTVLVAFELMDIDGCLLRSLRFMHLPTSKEIGNAFPASEVDINWSTRHAVRNTTEGPEATQSSSLSSFIFLAS